MESMLTRLEWLVGPQGIERLQQASVALFGVGGVGGGALEALVRAGVGRIVLIDGDVVSPSNLNRQLITTVDTISQSKVAVAAARAQSINPQMIVETYPIVYTDEAYPNFIEHIDVDYVIDAIDMVSAKVDLVRNCQRLGVPIICSMGGGNRMHPELFQFADIYKTHTDPLARVVRRTLRREGIKKQMVLFSTEEPMEPKYRTEGRSPGTVSFVPPVAGFLLASYVVRQLLEV